MFISIKIRKIPPPTINQVVRDCPPTDDGIVDKEEGALVAGVSGKALEVAPESAAPDVGVILAAPEVALAPEKATFPPVALADNWLIACVSFALEAANDAPIPGIIT